MMKVKEEKDIFDWAWEQRKKKVAPNEPRFSMSEVVSILRKYSDRETTEKKIRDYEKDQIVIPDPNRQPGKHRLYSVSKVLSLHLMLQGTKCFGKANTAPIVKLYEISRRQPKRHNPTIFDYDPKLPGDEKIHDILHKPLLESRIRQIRQIVNMLQKIDTFLHINDFARKNGIGFKCFDDELLEVKAAGETIKVAPPLTEWRSVKKSLDWLRYYKARAKVYGKYPESKRGKEEFNNKVNKTIISWLVKNEYAVKLRNNKTSAEGR